MQDIRLARQLARASTCDTRPDEWPQVKPLLRRLADRVEMAEALLATICHAEGPLEEGEACGVCGRTDHLAWCWYPALIQWDTWRAQQINQALDRGLHGK